MNHPDLSLIPWVFGILAVGWLVFAAVMFWRGRQQDRRWREQTRRWQHEGRVNQRVSELLKQEYKQLLTPEERQRREAQRQETIKNLGVMLPRTPPPPADPDTSAGTPPQVPGSGFSPAFARADAPLAWSIASAASCRNAC